MITKVTEPLAELYETDETAWLDAMAELIRTGRLGDLDYPHLAEYLEDMAIRDRREVKSRLRVLLGHLLKWTYQADMRTNSWRGTITVQTDDLEDNLETSGTLRNYAESILAESYAKAVKWTVKEMGLPVATFPVECPWTLDRLLSSDLLGD